MVLITLLVAAVVLLGSHQRQVVLAVPVVVEKDLTLILQIHNQESQL